MHGFSAQLYRRKLVDVFSTNLPCAVRKQREQFALLQACLCHPPVLGLSLFPNLCSHSSVSLLWVSLAQNAPQKEGLLHLVFLIQHTI